MGADSQGTRHGLAIRALRRIRRDTSSLLDALSPLRLRPPSCKTQIYYGQREPSAFAGQCRGGFVKLQLLQRAFPNSPSGGNALYLVSSALPGRPNLLAWAARVRGMPLVWNQNGVAYPGWHGPGWEHLNQRMSALMRGARHVIYQSSFCRLAADRFLGSAEATAEILHNPVDTSHFVPLQSPAPLEHLRILAGGTCYQRYRFEVAAQVIRCLVDARIDARLSFAGRPAWGELASTEAREIVERLGLSGRVDFVASYTQQQAPKVVGAAHILLHTKYNDNCPTLVLEAMACGMPVAYSSSGGTPELVGDDAGIGVAAPLDWEQQHPPDPEALADAVRRILPHYPRWSAAARKRAVDQFDLAPWLVRHGQIFAKLLEEG